MLNPVYGRGMVILSFCHITSDYSRPTRTFASSVIIRVFRYSIFRPVYEQSQLRDRGNAIIKQLTWYYEESENRS